MSPLSRIATQLCHGYKRTRRRYKPLQLLLLLLREVEYTGCYSINTQYTKSNIEKEEETTLHMGSGKPSFYFLAP